MPTLGSRTVYGGDGMDRAQEGETDIDGTGNGIVDCSFHISDPLTNLDLQGPLTVSSNGRHLSDLIKTWSGHLCGHSWIE